MAKKILIGSEVRKQCTKCNLCKTRKNIVHGKGYIPADFCFIGDYPNKTDNLFGEAFSGKIGDILDIIISDALDIAKQNFLLSNNILNINLPELKIYFTNLIFCTPIEKNEIREPSKEEIFLCSKNLQKILTKVNAKYFIFLGDLPEKYLKKSIKNYIKIIHPEVLFKNNSTKSGIYLNTVQKLSSIFLQWIESNNEKY